MEYVTKKVPKSLVADILELQAEYTLAEGRRVNESEIIANAVREYKRKPVLKKRYTLADLCGIAKGGPKGNAAVDLDNVVYGDVNRT